MDLEKSFKLLVSDDPCARAARRRELAAFSTSNNRILGAEELPMHVIRRDKRRGRNTHPSDEHVCKHITAPRGRQGNTVMDMIFFD
jgi:hypothetical protein